MNRMDDLMDDAFSILAGNMIEMTLNLHLYCTDFLSLVDVNALQFSVMPNRYIVRDCSLLFTLL